MAKVSVFISFDYDHDSDLKILLAGQAKHDDSPFDIRDLSLKEPLVGNWKEKIRPRIRNVEQMIVVCGENTGSATGVSAEVEIAQEIGVPYFLLWGRNGKTCQKPSSAKITDKIYEWTWDNLKKLIAGQR